MSAGGITIAIAARRQARRTGLALMMLGGLLASRAGSTGAQTPAARAGCAAGESEQRCLTRTLDVVLRLLRAPDSSPQALAMLRAACGRGASSACYLAGRLEVAQDLATDTATMQARLRAAAGLFRASCYSASEPSGDACNALADAYEYRLGVPIDDDSALAIAGRGCERGNATGCFRQSRRMEDRAELGPARFTESARLYDRACRAGSPGACINWVRLRQSEVARLPARERAIEHARMRRLYHGFCDRGKGELVTCNNIGSWFSEGRTGLPMNVDSAAHYYRLACLGQFLVRGASTPKPDTLYAGYGYACRNLGWLSIRSAEHDTVAGVKYFQKGCMLFDRQSCSEYAEYGFNIGGGRGGLEPYAALLLAVTTCFEGHDRSCNTAGWLLRHEVLGKDWQQSRRYYRQGCDLGYGWSCYQAGSLSRTALDDQPSAIKFFRRACDLRDDTGCTGLAEVLEKDFELTDKALAFYAQGCALDGADGCWSAARLYRERGDELNEGLVRAAACRIDRTYCKKER